MKVLLATDGSPGADEAAWFLSHLVHNEPMELTVLYVLQRPDFYEAAGEASWLAASNEASKKRAAEAYSRIVEMFDGANAHLSYVLVEGHAAQAIVQEAQTRQCDLVVMGARGQSPLSRLLLGSISEFVATHAPCSVLVVRPTGLRRTNKRDLRIAIAYDGSAPSQAAIDQFNQFEWRVHAPIDLITALPTVGNVELPIQYDSSDTLAAAKRANDLAAAKLHTHPNQVSGFVREAYHVGDTLVRFLDERRSDLVVLGDTGKGLLGRFLIGSVSRFVLTHAGCSVWVVRGHRGR